MSCHTLTTGDGITECEATSAADVASKLPPDYALRGTMRVEKLDDMLDTDVKVMKVRRVRWT